MKNIPCALLFLASSCGDGSATIASQAHRGDGQTLAAVRPAAPAIPATPASAPLEVQLNLIGYEGKGERLNYNYVLPSEETIRYFVSKGIKTYRLPMLWERLQPQAMGPLDEAKAAELEGFVKLAKRAGINVIVDLHNYGRRGDTRIGDFGLPTASLADFWGRFATRFKGDFAGYDLMNEPHDMPAVTIWPLAAQMAVDRIRSVDKTTTIYMEGDSNWSVGGGWLAYNANLDIHDPAHKLLYSNHIYFDKDTSGQYRNSFAADGVPVDIGVERLKPFVDWVRAKGVKGHVGEYGIPYADPGWYPVLDHFLNYAAQNKDVIAGATYWGAGTWMDFYALTLQPAKDGKWVDRPQLRVLLKPRY